MRIAVTGTRRGATPAQLEFLRKYLPLADRLVHGGAAGVDREAHAIYGYPEFTEIWPSNDEQLIWASRQGCTVLDILPPLVRNRQIVANSDLLYAFPRTQHEELRSGTWATIRYARNAGRKLVLVWPDGKCDESNRY